MSSLNSIAPDHGAVSLRSRLRRETAAAHDAVDLAFGRLSLGRAGDLSVFLSAHALAFDAMSRNGAGGSQAARLDDLLARIDADLDGDWPRGALAPVAGVPEVSVAYVVLGSRLGTGVLRRRWRAEATPEAMGMHRYWDAPGAGAEWRAFCDMTGGMPADGAEADGIVAGGRRLFHLFAEALGVAQSHRAAAHA